MGGSFFMRRLREYYSISLGREGPLGCVRIGDERVLFVGALDLRTHQMVLPQLERGDMELLLARVLTPPGGVFVDIGANVGVLSLLALSESVSAVHSFEPNPAMISRLHKTRLASPLAQRWYLHETAVGASKGHLKLYVNEHFSGTASLAESWQHSDKQRVDVPVTTLDHWCNTEHVAQVDVVKMDVEGWEFAVLDGARDTLRIHRPFVWFEHNLPALQRSGLDPCRVLDILQDLGYKFFFDIGRLPDHPSMSRAEVDEIAGSHVNLLAIPAERHMDFDARVCPLIRNLLGERTA